jgi:hypothetical protein
VSVETWHDPDLGRPIAAPLDRCAELLGVDPATVRELAVEGEPPPCPAPGSPIQRQDGLAGRVRLEGGGGRVAGGLVARVGGSRRHVPGMDGEAAELMAG